MLFFHRTLHLNQDTKLAALLIFFSQKKLQIYVYLPHQVLIVIRKVRSQVKTLAEKQWGVFLCTLRQMAGWELQDLSVSLRGPTLFLVLKWDKTMFCVNLLLLPAERTWAWHSRIFWLRPTLRQPCINAAVWFKGIHEQNPLAGSKVTDVVMLWHS